MTDQVLVVDDEPDVRMLLSATLEPLGLAVQTAADGDTALRMLEEQRFRVLMLDLRMPGAGGMEVLRHIAARHPAVRVVLVSAHGSVPDAVEAVRLGAVDVIRKPFVPAEVRELVRAVLDREALDASAAHAYGELMAVARRALTDRALDDARAAVRRAISLAPESAEAFNLLGVLHEIAAEHEPARRCYRVATELDPENALARENLARITRPRAERRGPPRYQR